MKFPPRSTPNLHKEISNTDDFVGNSKQLAVYFNKADYPIDLIQSALAETFVMDRDTPLIPKVKSTEKLYQDKKRIFLITTYHSTFNNVNSSVKDNWNLLDRSSSTCPMMDTIVVRGFRRAKHLRYHLVRARLSPMVTCTF